MYESFYGLKEKPFNLTPDPDYLYMSPGHENVTPTWSMPSRKARDLLS